jgi:hypothetical protein
MTLPHEKLADLLMEAGLAEMSFAAREYRYHDFRSKLAMPSMALLDELQPEIRRAQGERLRQLLEIRAMHMNGEFDATREESDAWAAGPEGQDAFGRLIRRE